MEMNFDNAIHVKSLEADFEKMTWTFQIDEKTPVGGGVYALVWVGPAPGDQTEVQIKMEPTDLSKIIGKWPGDVDDGFEAAIDEHRHGKKNRWNDPKKPPDAGMEVLVRIDSDEYPIGIAVFDSDIGWHLLKSEARYVPLKIIGWMDMHDAARILDGLGV